VFSNRASLHRECTGADVLVGAVLIPGGATLQIITRDTIGATGPKRVFVDIPYR
jgi:alanine dehydrogenase